MRSLGGESTIFSLSLLSKDMQIQSQGGGMGSCFRKMRESLLSDLSVISIDPCNTHPISNNFSRILSINLLESSFPPDLCNQGLPRSLNSIDSPYGCTCARPGDHRAATTSLMPDTSASVKLMRRMRSNMLKVMQANWVLKTGGDEAMVSWNDGGRSGGFSGISVALEVDILK